MAARLRSVGARALSSRRPTGRELLVAALLLLALGFAVFWPHIVHGGFYWDDWQQGGRTEYPPDGAHWLGPVDLGLARFRPFLALLIPLPHALFGLNFEWHLSLAVVLSGLTAACAWLFLRTVGLSFAAATPIAALMLLFPWSDSMVLWMTASLNWVGVALYLLGVVAALAGLRSSVERRARRLAVVSVVLYVVSVLTYEVAAVAALLSVGLYAREVPLRRALRRWALDLAAVGTAMAVVALNTQREMESLRGQVEHAGAIADQALTLLAGAVWPFGSPARAVVLVPAGVLVVAGLVAWWRLPRGSAGRAGAAWWTGVVLAAGVGVGAAYILLVPADSHYLPLAPGIENRINLLAAPAYATLVYALAALAATLALLALRRSSPAVVAVIAGSFSVAVGVAYLDRVNEDRRAWDLSTARQQRVLRALRVAVPDPPSGAAIYTYGVRRYVAPGVPVFAVSWDLKGAAKLSYEDGSLSAYPLPPNAKLVCRERTLYPATKSFDEDEASPYGRAYVVDVPRLRAVRIVDRRGCLRQADVLRHAGVEPSPR